MKNLIKYLVIVLMTTIFFSTIISTKTYAQVYDWQSNGYTNPIPNTTYLVQGLLVPKTGNPFGIVKQKYTRYSFRNDKTGYTFYSVGEYLGAVSYAIVQHGYPYDNGFNDLFVDDYPDVSNIVSIVMSPGAEIHEINYEDFKEWWYQPLYIVDNSGSASDGSGWSTNLAMSFTKVLLKDLDGQRILFYNCKPLFHMDNGSPIAVNDPRAFDHQQEYGKWGYKDTMITKMIIGQSLSETPIPKQNREPKAPDICPPNLPDPQAEELAKALEDLNKSKEQLAQATGMTTDLFDQNITLGENVSDLEKALNQAVQQQVLADANVAKLKKELDAAREDRSTTKENLANLTNEFEQAKVMHFKTHKELNDLKKLNSESNQKIDNLEVEIAGMKDFYQSKVDSAFEAQRLELASLKKRMTVAEKLLDVHDKKITENQKVNARQDEGLTKLKEADKAQREALGVVETVLTQEIGKLDTKIEEGLKKLDTRLVIAESEAARANKRADDAFKEAQAAKQEAVAASVKASEEERKRAEQKIQQKLIDDEQDRNNIAVQNTADKALQGVESLKQEIEVVKTTIPKGVPPVIAANSTSTVKQNPPPVGTGNQNTNKNVQKKKKNIKYVYGPDSQTTVKKTVRLKKPCPSGDCGDGEEQVLTLKDVKTGQIITVPASQIGK